MKLELMITIYVILLIIIFVFRLLSIYLNNEILLTKKEYNFLFISALLYLLIMYFIKSYVSETNIDYMIPVGIFYIVWYIITNIIMFIINKLTT